MEKKPSTPRRSREEMFSLVTAWQNSGISQDIFCKQRQVPYNVFHYWLRKLKRETSEEKSGFVEIDTHSQKSFASCCEIIFPSGAKLLVNGDADPAFIRSLIF